MKKMLLLSDSHGMSGIFNYVLKEHDDIDFYVHLGDIEDRDAITTFKDKFYFVRGNNDFAYIPYDESQARQDTLIQARRSDVEILTDFLQFEIEGIRFMATHGDMISLSVQEYVYYNEDIDILLFGHTHRFSVVKDENKIVGINPGSCCPLVARGDRKASYCVVTIDNKEIIDITRYYVEDWLGYEM